MEKRLKWLDISKGIGILIVVAGHASIKYAWFFNAFVMETFFFLSGYVFNERYSLGKLIHKKLRLYRTFLLYEFVFISLHNVQYTLCMVEDKYSLLEFGSSFLRALLFDNAEILLSPIWYLTALFTVNLMFGLLFAFLKNSKYKKNVIGVICILAMLLGVFLTRHGINLTISYNFKEWLNTCMASMIFFYSGWLYKTQTSNIVKSVKLWEYVMCIVCVGVMIICLKVFHLSTGMLGNNHSNIIAWILNSYSGCYIIVFISKWIEDRTKNLSMLFSYIGKRSLTIMCLHMLSFKLADTIVVMTSSIYTFPMMRGWGVVDSSGLNGIVYMMTGLLIPIGLENVWNLIKNIKVQKKRVTEYKLYE